MLPRLAGVPGGERLQALPRAARGAFERVHRHGAREFRRRAAPASSLVRSLLIYPFPRPTLQTTYQFEVLANFGEKALDVFSHFFISPLFTESGTRREVQGARGSVSS